MPKRKLDTTAGNTDEPNMTAQITRPLPVHLQHSTGGTIQQADSLAKVGFQSGALSGTGVRLYKTPWADPTQSFRIVRISCSLLLILRPLTVQVYSVPNRMSEIDCQRAVGILAKMFYSVFSRIMDLQQSKWPLSCLAFLKHPVGDRPLPEAVGEDHCQNQVQYNCFVNRDI